MKLVDAKVVKCESLAPSVRLKFGLRDKGWCYKVWEMDENTARIRYQRIDGSLAQEIHSLVLKQKAMVV